MKLFKFVKNGMAGKYEISTANRQSMAVITVFLLLAIVFQGATGQVMRDDTITLDAAAIPTPSAAYGPLVNKTFYLQRVNESKDVGGAGTTLQIANTSYPSGAGFEADGTSLFYADWFVFPVIAGNLTLDGEFSITIWSDNIGVGSGSGLFICNLTEVMPDGTEFEFASGEITQDYNFGWQTYGLAFDVNHTIGEGSALKITLIMDGPSSVELTPGYGGVVDGAMRDSNISLPCRNYIDVDSVYTIDNEGNITTTFLPDSPNKNITIKTNITNPFGGYDIQWANITLKDPSGGIIVNNATMNKTYGFFNTFESQFEFPWNYSSFPNGTYRVVVRAVDNNGLRAWNLSGGADFGGHEVYGFHEFVIGGLDYYVNIRVVDDMGINLTGTKVIVQELGTEYQTDVNGTTNLSLGNSIYTLSVIWQDVHVSVNTTIDVTTIGNRTEKEPYNITAGVYYPTARVLDSAGIPVGQANIYITHPNGTTGITPLETDDGGEVQFIQMAEGTYELQVFWKGRSVGTNSTLMDSSSTFNVTVSICYLQVIVEDQASMPVSGALVVFTYSDTGLVADSQLTVQNGSVFSRLPGTDYKIVVYWSDARVYDGTHDLTASTAITVSVGIYEVDVTILDSTGLVLGGAEVTAIFNSTGRQMHTGTTDDNGQIFFQLAKGEHRFDVRWLGEDIASELFIIDQNNTSLVITAAVYQLQIMAVDSTGDANILANATVSVFMNGEAVDTGMTDQTGTYISRLPAGDVDIKISWKGIQVYEAAGITVSGNDVHTAVCAVYYLNITVVDSDNVTVEGASVEVLNSGILIASETSNTLGSAVVRLPLESYSIVVAWMGVEVASVDHDMVAVQGGNSLTVVCDIFNLTVNIEDAMGENVSDTTIYIELRGDSLLTIFGGDDGTATLRLPGENYTLMVNWRGFIVNETAIVLNASMTADLVATIYRVTLMPEDSRGATIPNAEVTVGHGMDTYATGWTDADGALTLLIPQGEFQVMVEWHGINVYRSEHAIAENGPLALPCDVYYLTVEGRDADNITVRGLEVSMYHASLPGGHDFLATATIDDTVTVRVPAGTINVLGKWKGFDVADSSVNVTADISFTLECKIYYLQVTVEDSEGQPLHGAELVVTETNGTTFATSLTEQGAASPRLPEGEWTLAAYWQGQEVGSAIKILNETEADGITIVTSVHYIRLVVRGDGEAIPGVEVSLIDSSGNSIMTLTTDAEGKATFEQMAEGDYTIVASLKKTEMMTNINLREFENITLTASQDIDVDFGGYPLSFFSTNLFFAILLFAMAAAPGTFLIYRKIKSTGKNGPEDGEEPKDDTGGEPENDGDPGTEAGHDTESNHGLDDEEVI